MRGWVSETDHGWVMRCDTERANGSRCPTSSEAFDGQPDLAIFIERGWSIGQKSGDICPACLSRGYVPTSARHHLMGVTNG